MSVPPRDTSCLSGEQDWGYQQSPHPAVLFPTTCSRSSSQTLGKYPPATLPSSATSFPTSRVPWAGPATKSSATVVRGCVAHVVFWVWECFGGSTRLSQMVLSTWYVFSCLPSTHCVSASRQQSPCSIPSHIPHLEVLCHICILISPLLAPKGLSHVSAVGGYSCPALCHTHPVGLIPGVGKARLIPCPLPSSTCLYITLEWSLHLPRP